MNTSITLNPEQIKKILGDDQSYQTITDDMQNRILERIAQGLVETDFLEIERLNKEDDEHGSKVKAFLLTRLPNLDKIIEEEAKV